MVGKQESARLRMMGNGCRFGKSQTAPSCMSDSMCRPLDALRHLPRNATKFLSFYAHSACTASI